MGILASFEPGMGWTRAGVLPVGYQLGAADEAGRAIAVKIPASPSGARAET